MEIRNLSTFIKVVEEQSLSKAAKQLGYAQSTVTMQMQQLESELGVSLYERVGRQIRITQEGQALLGYAVQILKVSEEAQQIGCGGGQNVDGILRLGLADTVGSELQGRLLGRFAALYPGVQLVVEGGGSQELVQRLLHNQIDLVMTVDHRITDSTLIRVGEKEEAVHFVTTPDHPLRSYSLETGEGGVLNLPEILSHPIIRGDRNSLYEQDLDQEMLNQKISPGNWSEVGSQQVLINLILYQKGMALLPDLVIKKYLEEKQLIRLNYKLPKAELWQQTLYHKNKWMTGAMSAWIKLMEESL